MARLKDLRKSISEMSPEEVSDCITTIRFNRRQRKPTMKPQATTQKRKSKILDKFNEGQLREMIKRLEG